MFASIFTILKENSREVYVLFHKFVFQAACELTKIFRYPQNVNKNVKMCNSPIRCVLSTKKQLQGRKVSVAAVSKILFSRDVTERCRLT